MELQSTLRRITRFEYEILRGAWKGFCEQDRKHLIIEAAVALAGGIAAVLAPLRTAGVLDPEIFGQSLVSGLLVAFILGLLFFLARLVAEPSRAHEALTNEIQDLETSLKTAQAQAKVPARPPDKEKERQRKIYQDWMAEAKLVIPALDKYTFDILASLSKGEPMYLTSKWDSVKILLDKHYIICHHVPKEERRGQRLNLYSIQASLIPLVQEEHARRCAKLVSSLALGDKSEEYRRALEFFAQGEDDLRGWPGPLSSDMTDLYWTFRDLDGKGLLEKKERGSIHERFEIKDDFEALVQKHFLGDRPILREFIEFSLREVRAPNHSGGGPHVEFS